MNKRGNVIIGAILVILGGLFILKNLGIFYFNIFSFGFIMSTFWATLFLIIPGLAMHSIFFSGKMRGPGILVPAGILLVSGITCQLSALFNIWGVLWPGFILSVAIGLFELYLFGGRPWGLLIPVAILGGMSLIFFNVFSINALLGPHFKQFFIPVVLILLGVLVIFRNKPRRNDFK